MVSFFIDVRFWKPALSGRVSIFKKQKSIMEKQEQILKIDPDFFEKWIRMAELDVIFVKKIYDASLPDN